MSEIGSTTGARSYQYTRDPASLTKFLRTMLWILVGMGVVSMFSSLAQMSLLSSDTFSQAQAESNDARQQAVAVIYLCAFVLTGIAFLKWIHRANLNCHGFGAQGMVYSPGWSIGYYFIPILSLYKPYHAMKEIYAASRNPSTWQNEMSTPLLGWWWALWLISGFLGQASFRLTMAANTVELLQASTTVSIIDDISQIILCIVAISLVSAVSMAQERLVGNHPEEGLPAGSP